MAAAKTLRERAGGKWQIPAVLLSLALLGTAIHRAEREQRTTPEAADLVCREFESAHAGGVPKSAGPEPTRMAVETLDLILRDSAVFTPEAPEFQDALFLLGDIHLSEGAFERGISVLEEALERYPHDPRAARAKFLLADAYRQSALALERESGDPAPASDRPRMRSEATARFSRAAGLFAELVENLSTDEGVGPMQPGLRELLAKHARLYQADCLFELGRQSEAVALYETAAFIYRDEPSALSAYVQIVNCRLSMGQLAEARTALRRARYLLQIIPDSAFDEVHAGQNRREWERYIDWLTRSDLF